MSLDKGQNSSLFMPTGDVVTRFGLSRDLIPGNQAHKILFQMVARFSSLKNGLAFIGSFSDAEKVLPLFSSWGVKVPVVASDMASALFCLESKKIDGCLSLSTIMRKDPAPLFSKKVFVNKAVSEEFFYFMEDWVKKPPIHESFYLIAEHQSQKFIEINPEEVFFRQIELLFSRGESSRDLSKWQAWFEAQSIQNLTVWQKKSEKTRPLCLESEDILFDRDFFSFHHSSFLSRNHDLDLVLTPNLFVNLYWVQKFPIVMRTEMIREVVMWHCFGHDPLATSLRLRSLYSDRSLKCRFILKNNMVTTVTWTKGEDLE